MEIVSLKNPYPNGVPEKDHDLLQPFIDVLNEIIDKVNAGERVYLEITSGERKGSIAYIKEFDSDYDQKEPVISYSRYFRDHTARISSPSLMVILGWDKRRNKIKWSTSRSTNYLRGYKGETVWEKFDKKKAEAKLLEENDIVDREGNVLKEGDRVVYINARYGSGGSLDRGTIEQIKFNVQKYEYNDAESQTVHVIIRNDNGQKSDIKRPELSILKLDKINA